VPVSTGTVKPLAAPSLELTGERTLPGIPDENYWFRRHEAAYLALTPFVTGAGVLEAGCGEGYGAHLVAQTATYVLGVDYDAVTAGHAQRAYPDVHLVRGDIQRLPVADAGVEVVACLQVIEHLWDQPGFIAECARVLRPAGTLLLTTPNRRTFSPTATPGERPLNPFHTRELSAAELTELLAPHFVVTRMHGLRHGRSLSRFERRHHPLVSAQIAGPPETWAPTVRRRVHRVRATDFDVSSENVDTSLDLITVARKRTSADR
jgi:SAM-dependent methyltransferase